MIEEHAVIASSGMPRTVPCPGNIQAQTLYFEEESEESREGTAAHWVGSEVLDSWKAGGAIKLCTDFLDVTACLGRRPEEGQVTCRHDSENRFKRIE